MKGNQPEYLPTPGRIAQECARIRDNWSDEERIRRLVGGQEVNDCKRWTLPEIATSHCMSRVRSTVLGLAT
ncbi:hypothetical protein [Adhaeretor mobilis]|uniref:Uncharacterized protein n=1 Tax=Adhaeretor mobilis TaxID=1930276 RepID=A0A517N342_9BACT|nr:hypothetical protein [Adhaeretor mobilis]QDT01555.1 hypothetical protein HG15A2_49020 [Adhaeretor mobilis]